MAKLKKSEKIYVGIAMSTLVYVLINTFVCGKEEPEREVTQGSEGAKATATVASIPQHAQTPKPARTKMREPRDRVEFASWARDPFAEAFRLIPPDTTESDSGDFVLRGIIWKGNSAHALIGDDIVKEGEQIGDIRILDIQKDRVICRKGKEVITLMLRENEE